MNKTIFDNQHSQFQRPEQRDSQQLLLPLQKTSSPEGTYDIYPAFNISETIYSGHQELAEWIAGQGHNMIIEGFSGVYWENFIAVIDKCLRDKNIFVNWVNADKVLKTPPEIEDMLSPYSGGDDPLFGKIYEGSLLDFFDQQALFSITPLPNRLNIIYGCGASLFGWAGALIYLEVPKNEIQFRSRAGGIKNLGRATVADAKVQYKRFYFIDWPVLNKHKSQLLGKIDVIVDEQRIADITWTTGPVLRGTLENMTRHSFRARPWFEPGVWGGSWIKDHISGLNKQVRNYAWSFELIAPENGILIESNGILLEVSFDCLLFFDSPGILGKAAERFGHSFPIRFDFLDTFDGGNLSLQCHPSVAYTRANFGEAYTQDETYYILDSRPNAKVYLGFCEDINKDVFRAEMENSFQNHVPVDVENYVQTFPAKKHDLFLIPNGTIHCSGENNMVLEISATPYIYTFKIYDWLRPDLNGQPRPLNIERAFENLRFDRKGATVPATLIAQPEVISETTDQRLVSLPTHPEHFYAVERIEFDTRSISHTNGHCHVLSLVEGSNISVKTGSRIQQIHYAETFIIPAAAVSYELINNGEKRAKVIRAFVKDEN